MAVLRCRRDCCGSQPIARLLQFFPKIALLFLIVHVAAMIYSALYSSPNTRRTKHEQVKQTVVDMQNRLDEVQDLSLTKNKDLEQKLENGADGKLPNLNYKDDPAKLQREASKMNDSKLKMDNRLMDAIRGVNMDMRTKKQL